MYDRPTAEELIQAARMHLESAVVPVVRRDGKLYFQTLVAINVLRIVERELKMGAAHAGAEWERLNALEGSQRPLPPNLSEIKAELTTRNAALCGDIRAGKYDVGKQKQALLDHLKVAAVEQLMVANPKFLQTLAQEDANPELDAWHRRLP